MMPGVSRGLRRAKRTEVGNSIDADCDLGTSSATSTIAGNDVSSVIVHQMRLFIQAGLIEEPQAGAFLHDIEELNAAGTFSASFIIQAATGTKADA